MNQRRKNTIPPCPVTRPDRDAVLAERRAASVQALAKMEAETLAHIKAEQEAAAKNPVLKSEQARIADL